VVAIALLAVAALVVAATGLGLVLRNRTGRARRVRGDVLDARVLGAGPLGDRGTLLQLSTPMCTQCGPTARLLGEVAASRPGVTHLEVDLTERPGLADRLHVLQTPTTFLLDAGGRIRGRIGGRPRPDQLARELDLLLETP
jgi:hypothetical protein